MPAWKMSVSSEVSLVCLDDSVASHRRVCISPSVPYAHMYGVSIDTDSGCLYPGSLEIWHSLDDKARLISCWTSENIQLRPLAPVLRPCSYSRAPPPSGPFSTQHCSQAWPSGCFWLKLS